MAKEWEPGNLFDVFGAESARRILALASAEPRSAEELADRLEVSQPTVYRRVDVLRDYDLLREEIRIDDEGNHYTAYETNLERVAIRVGDGELVVDLTLSRDPPDGGEGDGDFAE